MVDAVRREMVALLLCRGSRHARIMYTGRLALQVVADFLDHFELHQTLSILKMEADLVRHRP